MYIDYCMYHDKACALHKDLVDTNPAFVSTLEKLHMSKRQVDTNGRRKFDDYLIMVTSYFLWMIHDANLFAYVACTTAVQVQADA